LGLVRPAIKSVANASGTKKHLVRIELAGEHRRRRKSMKEVRKSKMPLIVGVAVVVVSAADSRTGR